jgi:hypothetical protein
MLYLIVLQIINHLKPRFPFCYDLRLEIITITVEAA